MLSLFLHLFEKTVMEEKEVREAREKVRAAMRERFSFIPGTRVSATDESSTSAPAMASTVKPYIPPTIPTDDPVNPFGLREPVMGAG